MNVQITKIFYFICVSLFTSVAKNFLCDLRAFAVKNFPRRIQEAEAEE